MILTTINHHISQGVVRGFPVSQVEQRKALMYHQRLSELVNHSDAALFEFLTPPYDVFFAGDTGVAENGDPEFFLHFVYFVNCKLGWIFAVRCSR